VGIEPTSSAWKAEVLPLNYTRRCTAPADLEPISFSPPPRPVVWWRGKDSNLRRRKPADLQSAPVGRLGTPPRKRAAYSDFQGAGCQCVLARKLLADAPARGAESLERGRRRLGRSGYRRGTLAARAFSGTRGPSQRLSRAAQMPKSFGGGIYMLFVRGHGDILRLAPT
jgi:hypothetical protein